jgi:hypothetical protein
MYNARLCPDLYCYNAWRATYSARSLHTSALMQLLPLPPYLTAQGQVLPSTAFILIKVIIIKDGWGRWR